MAEPDEVRAWAREQGLDVSERGKLPRHITDAYNAVHDEETAWIAANGKPLASEDAGVTEADFPPPLEPGDDDATPERTAPKRERRPRVVKPAARRKGWKNVFGGGQAKPKQRGPRTDLSEFAEDTWRDLALLSSGIMPPVSRVLTIQAPYAGIVFDEAVKGLPVVDAVLQPVARASVSLRALNGLLGPVFFTAGITVSGEWVTDEAGQPVFGPDGRPVPTQRTAMMIGGLKYSLLQMSRTADLGQVQARAEVDAERMRSVDALVDFIFGFPPAAAPDVQPHAQANGQEHAHPHAPDGVLVPSFVYPPPPQMDDTGARA